MAVTEIYVDPSLDASPQTGSGTVGDPYSDLEYAIINETFDTTNGTRINIKAGTDEVLAADLSTALADTSVTPAWAPTMDANLIFEGYTSVAGDGGIGGISGGGSVGIISGGSLDYTNFVNLHLHNTGSQTIVLLNNYCSLINCELDNTSGSAVSMDFNGLYVNNYIHNCSVAIAAPDRDSIVAYNYIEDIGANSMSAAISGGSLYYRNIIKLRSGTAVGIALQSVARALNNSVYSDGGTGAGITVSNAVWYANVVSNNLIEGFSGSGGTGIDMSASNFNVKFYGGNSVYNCETAFDVTGHVVFDFGDNEELTASPFTDAANGDFSPVDTGSVKEGSVPTVIGGGLVP